MDLLNHKMTVKFSEPVDTNTFKFTSLYLENFFSDPPSVLALSNSQVDTIEEVGTLVVFSISLDDMNSLKALRHLCSFRGDCYLRIKGDFVKDKIGKAVEPTPAGKSLLCNVLVDDIDKPKLKSFSLNVNAA
jgi:hypothetical protein